jgi:hypothetical protein
MLMTTANHKKAAYSDSDERIATFMENTPLPEDSDLWTVAVLAFKPWAAHCQHDLFFPQNLGSQKEGV